MKKRDYDKVCIVECGNKSEENGFDDKIKLLNQFISNGVFSRINRSTLIYKHGNEQDTVLLVHGKKEASGINSILKDYSIVILHGSCCSLLITFGVGSIIVPELITCTTGESIYVNRNLVSLIKPTKNKYRIRFCIGKLGQVDSFIKSKNFLLSWQKDNYEFFDQETFSIAKICIQNNIIFLPILYVSDNLEIGLSKSIVDSSSELKKIKLRAKKSSFLFATHIANKLRRSFALH